MVAFEFGREVMERLRQSNVASILEVMLTDIGALPIDREMVPHLVHISVGRGQLHGYV